MSKFKGKRRDIYKEVTDKIIKQLAAGTSPWRKDWKSDPNTDGAFPYNATTGKNYSGINVLTLLSSAEDSGFTSNGWITFNQCRTLGGSVKGQKSAGMVVYFDMIPKKDNPKEFFPMMKYTPVFNLDQVTGIDSDKLKRGQIMEAVEPTEIAAMLQAAGMDLQHGGNRAFYRPSSDHVQMPRPEQFSSPEGYHGTLLHEATHWTGAKHRTDRKGGKRFGDPAYAFEELVAEIGASFLCASLGVDYELENHTSYLASWLKCLEEDDRAIFNAASLAQKACDYVLNAITETITEATEAA